MKNFLRSFIYKKAKDKKYTVTCTKLVCLFLILLLSNSVKAQQVTEVVTDFGGFWKSTVGALNPTFPNTSHNVLSFKYSAVTYSTGVDDNKLTTNGVSFTAGDFRAFPVATVGGTVTGGASIYVALASRYDGIPNGYSNPLPYLKIKDVLIDGIHGLNLGTGATNIPASALVNFPISTVISGSIADAKPDILVSQIASPTSTGDTLFFTNSSGTVVGNKIAINWTSISTLGTWYLDLYSLPTGSLCDTAHINGTADKETTRDIRLIAFKLSDFGITAGNASTVAGFVLKASGTSDPAFIAYNTDAFVIPAPVITVQPVSQVVCPNVSNSATFSVTATGGSLSYQWKKNNTDIPGATSASYTIPNVTSASAGAYMVEVSNPVGSVNSNTVYLNISVAVQPSPSGQLIATGAGCSLSVSANNATGYQWRRNGVNISGANSSSYVINDLNAADSGSYAVQIINSASGGCANIVSNVVVVSASTTLYSKPSVNLNLPGSWGVATDGSGSSPVNFTRAEHTFIVKNNASTGGNLTIAGTLDVGNAVTTITAGTTLDAGKIIRSGTGSLAGSATSGLTVRGNSNLYFQPGNNLLKDLTIQNGTVNLLNPLSLTAGSSAGTLALNGGILNTGDSLTLKSDIAGTARMASITGGASVNGKLVIERYIPAARGWRLLSVPIESTGAPTINASWQEGLTTASANPNLYPGYGVKIAGGTTANGFDQSNTNSPFIKAYNTTTNSFLPLPSNPGTNIPLTSYPAYLLYIRGDRSIDLMQGLNSAITSTTLRTRGQVKTGNQVYNVNATNFTMIGNPYPSAIDFGTLSKSNVSNTMYLWDPKLAGSYGLGAYVTVSWDNATGTYDVTASTSPVSQYVQSGEVFFVRSADNVNPGTLTIHESDKTASGNDQVFRYNGLAQRLRTNLYLVNSNGTESLLDGVLTTFDDLNSNTVDTDDAAKMMNSGETISLTRNNTALSIERRKIPVSSDTLFLNLAKVRLQSYKLEITAENLDMPGLVAFVKDNYSNTINGTPVNMNGLTNINFSINTDPASYAADRFSIVFSRQAPLPVTFTSVKAQAVQKSIAVKWTTASEINIKKYIVERAADGTNFTELKTTAATATNGGNAAYDFLDETPLDGNNYYRIRSVSNAGEISYSDIVKVTLKSLIDVPAIVVYPNPVSGHTIQVQFNNIPKGNYIMQLFNTAGQLTGSKKIQYDGNTAACSFELTDNFPTGKYELKLTGEAVELNAHVIKE